MFFPPMMRLCRSPSRRRRSEESWGQVAELLMPEKNPTPHVACIKKQTVKTMLRPKLAFPNTRLLRLLCFFSLTVLHTAALCTSNQHQLFQPLDSTHISWSASILLTPRASKMTSCSCTAVFRSSLTNWKQRPCSLPHLAAPSSSRLHGFRGRSW